MSYNNGDNIRRLGDRHIVLDADQTTTSTSISSLSILRVHHGALDRLTVTTHAPPDVMRHVREVLGGMGVEIQRESEYRYRCIRVRRKETPSLGLGLQPDVHSQDPDASGTTRSQPSLPLDDTTTLANTSKTLATESRAMHAPVYGDATQDPGDEIRFFVELTRVAGLNDTFSLDIRRLKGNLRSYKFLYDTLTERANLRRKNLQSCHIG